jgi:hypothetical protein
MHSNPEASPNDLSALRRLLALPECECRRAQLPALVDATSSGEDVRRWCHALDAVPSLITTITLAELSVGPLVAFIGIREGATYVIATAKIH